MKQILIINTVGFQYEGITSVILNYIKGMNREDIHFVFPIYNNIHPALKGELELLGDTVFIPNRKKNVVGYTIQLFRYLKKHFDVVHIHGNSGTMLIETLLAKCCGVKNVIIHVHSTQTNHPVVNKIMKGPMMRLSDKCIACSTAAGDWLYGKYPYVVLNNAIDLEKYRFSEEARKKYRNEFGLEDAFVIGHIGHFTAQKNHFFLIDVFYEFHKLEPNSKLLLLSDGPRFEEVKSKAEGLGLRNAVIFAGRRSDIAGIYSAMDLFILPSCWEGLPLTMVEAQANGLPLLVSDVITVDAKCTDRTFYNPITDDAKSWAVQLQIIKNRNYDRKLDDYGAVVEKGFDIQTEADKLRTMYMMIAK